MQSASSLATARWVAAMASFANGDDALRANGDDALRDHRSGTSSRMRRRLIVDHEANQSPDTGLTHLHRLRGRS
jgi:hypothetical protein